MTTFIRKHSVFFNLINHLWFGFGYNKSYFISMTYQIFIFSTNLNFKLKFLFNIHIISTLSSRYFIFQIQFQYPNSIFKIFGQLSPLISFLVLIWCLGLCVLYILRFFVPMICDMIQYLARFSCPISRTKYHIFSANFQFLPKSLISYSYHQHSIFEFIFSISNYI